MLSNSSILTNPVYGCRYRRRSHTETVRATVRHTDTRRNKIVYYYVLIKLFSQNILHIYGALLWRGRLMLKLECYLNSVRLLIRLAEVSCETRTSAIFLLNVFFFHNNISKKKWWTYCCDCYIFANICLRQT